MTKEDHESLNRARFYELVRDDVKGRAGDAAAVLREPTNVQPWYETLIEMKREVELEMTSNKAALETLRAESLASGDEALKRAFFEAKRNYEAWKIGAAKFKNRIENRVTEVKALRHQYHLEGKLGRSPSTISQMLLSQAARYVPRDGEGAAWHAAYEALKGESAISEDHRG